MSSNVILSWALQCKKINWIIFYYYVLNLLFTFTFIPLVPLHKAIIITMTLFLYFAFNSFFNTHMFLVLKLLNWKEFWIQRLSILLTEFRFYNTIEYKCVYERADVLVFTGVHHAIPVGIPLQTKECKARYCRTHECGQ